MHDYLRTVVVAPMTTASHPAPYRIAVAFDGKHGLILLDQIRTLNKKHLIKRLGAIDDKTLADTLSTLQELFAEWHGESSMPLLGGAADKAGNRYELRWTVRQFIRLLTGDAAWILLEPVGEEGEGIEFQLARQDGRIDAHQVKRQQAGRGHWTVADLGRVGVLDGIRKHTVDGDADFVFVSTQAPKSLPELQDRAESAPDFSAFQASLSLELKRDFDDFQRQLGVESGERAWRAVRQSRWIALDERELGDIVLAFLGAP